MTAMLAPDVLWSMTTCGSYPSEMSVGSTAAGSTAAENMRHIMPAVGRVHNC
jgi:hypothetical protein